MATHYEDEKKGKIVKYIKDSIINILVVAVALAYIFFQQVQIEATEASLISLLGKSVLGIICGVMIKQGLGENGFSKAYNGKIWNEELDKYNAACNTANEYMERVDNFYYYEEIEKRKKNRRAIMMGARLKYNDFFDDEENFIGHERMATLSRQQKIAIERCVKIKIYNLNLFSEYSSASTSDTKPEKTDAKQRAKMAGKNSLSQILVACAGAYFIPIITGWNWATFIMATLQVAMWCASGIMQLYTNYNYVTVDKVNKMKKKKELIQKFVYGCKQGMYKDNPYELREKARLQKEIAEQKKEVEAPLEPAKAPIPNVDAQIKQEVKPEPIVKPGPTQEEIQKFSLLTPGSKEYEEMIAKFGY